MKDERIMKKIGLFYAANAVKTSQIAKKIREALGTEYVDIIPAEQAWGNDFEAYDNLIVGVSTWFDGELPTYWDELIPELETLDLKGKRVALFGLGDQVNYPDNFVDGLGILGDAFEKAGAALVGFTPASSTRINANLLITKRLAFLFYSCCTTIAQLGSRIWKILIVLLYFFKYKIDIKSYFSYYEYLTFYHLYIIVVDCFKGVGIY